jgi:hypothetical protein
VTRRQPAHVGGRHTRSMLLHTQLQLWSNAPATLESTATARRVPAGMPHARARNRTHRDQPPPPVLACGHGLHSTQRPPAPRRAHGGGGGIVTSSHARTHARTHAEHVGRRRRRTRRRSRALGALRSAPPVIHDTENRSTRPVGRVASSMKLCAASQRPHPAAHWPPTGHALIMHRASQPHPLCTGQRS